MELTDTVKFKVFKTYFPKGSTWNLYDPCCNRYIQANSQKEAVKIMNRLVRAAAR